MTAGQEKVLLDNSPLLSLAIADEVIEASSPTSTVWELRSTVSSQNWDQPGA
ncbi:MAG: hypothetical protein R2715_24175 [Ilumatobacteraceae bacterium]